MKKATTLAWIAGFSLLDQVIKIIIQSRFLETRFDIVPHLLEFRPKYNFDYSYVNQTLNLGMTRWGTILLTIFLGVVFLWVYRLFRHYSKHKRGWDWGFVFVFSALICALLSHFFWEGVLDYIYLKPLFIFDLKDVYGWTGVICVWISQIRDYRDGVRITWEEVKARFKIHNKKGSE